MQTNTASKPKIAGAADTAQATEGYVGSNKPPRSNLQR